MFTLYRIDFRSGSEIDPIQCEQCSQGNRTRSYRFGVELFILYRIDMLHICFCLEKKRCLESKKVITRFLSKNGADPLGFARSHYEWSVPKSHPIRNVSRLESERSNSKSSQELCPTGVVKCEQKAYPIQFWGAPIIDPE